MDFPEVTAAAIVFNYIDNLAQIIVENNNGRSIAFSYRHENDDQLDLLAPLLPNLAVGPNTIIVQLFNTAGEGQNPWHIKFTTSVNGSVIQNIEDSGPDGSGVGLMREYRVVFTAGAIRIP